MRLFHPSIHDDDDEVAARWQPKLYTADLQARLSVASLVAPDDVKPSSRSLSTHFRDGLPLAVGPAVCPYEIVT